MAKNDYSNPVLIDETKVIFGEIASLAAHGDEMCYHFGGNEDVAEMVHQLKFMRDLVNKLGLLADLGADKLGGGMIRGGAEEWMLPPAYKWPSEKAAKEAQS